MKYTISHLGYRIDSRMIFTFIVSFFIAWLLWNWQITFALFFYHAEHLKKATSFDTHFDLVVSYATVLKSFFGPLCSAMLYTLVAFSRNNNE